MMKRPDSRRSWRFLNGSTPMRFLALALSPRAGHGTATGRTPPKLPPAKKLSRPACSSGLGSKCCVASSSTSSSLDCFESGLARVGRRPCAWWIRGPLGERVYSGASRAHGGEGATKQVARCHGSPMPGQARDDGQRAWRMRRTWEPKGERYVGQRKGKR